MRFATKCLTAMLLVAVTAVQAQTADEIIEKYIKNTGGKDKWLALKSVKMAGKAKQGGLEFPFVSLQAQGGKQRQAFTFQGKEIVQPAFDGNSGWNTNMMTMKAEKMEAEDSENMKQEAADFPDPFLNYKEKGYKVTLEGKETVEGTECFKIKLTKKPVKVDGKPEENVVYYFFEPENFVPVVSRSTIKKGQMKGTTIESAYSDYQEVNGLMFPFSISQKANGQPFLTIAVEKVELDTPIDPKEFAFPAGN
ncbi:MAG: outer membrane lipoprotein-sorting protein [Cytophagales bacterium]|nr:outer membrane lipoprotein-sorting protein [Cytophagales bacterium]